MRDIEVVLEAGPRGGHGLTVLVSGRARPGMDRGERGVRKPPPPPEFDDDDLLDPGGCEF
ncbi:hypothetical protein Nocox_03185 [Nonomuraea coxensis DSM 45129]|uniref:Uncharacterized protein n=1 Tax=Nonomuraea coxensis DSM 45129 TaxID=1122611 RepID=A0ABX8TSG8_9ACTN|nr:hypothetical protein [Nonomuraea coxensis]QYC38267.1 hypothetical protein Nocox_03185 [Nonomuraea coxensis DSM 45129]